MKNLTYFPMLIIVFVSNIVNATGDADFQLKNDSDFPLHVRVISGQLTKMQVGLKPGEKFEANLEVSKPNNNMELELTYCNSMDSCTRALVQNQKSKLKSEQARKLVDLGLDKEIKDRKVLLDEAEKNKKEIVDKIQNFKDTSLEDATNYVLKKQKQLKKLEDSLPENEDRSPEDKEKLSDANDDLEMARRNQRNVLLMLTPLEQEEKTADKELNKVRKSWQAKVDEKDRLEKELEDAIENLERYPEQQLVDLYNSGKYINNFIGEKRQYSTKDGETYIYYEPNGVLPISRQASFTPNNYKIVFIKWNGEQVLPQKGSLGGKTKEGQSLKENVPKANIKLTKPINIFSNTIYSNF